MVSARENFKNRNAQKLDRGTIEGQNRISPLLEVSCRFEKFRMKFLGIPSLVLRGQK